MIMWVEYTTGIGERKATKYFTMAKRNNRIGRQHQTKVLAETASKLVEGRRYQLLLLTML
jgi:hypothetical protein